MKPTNKPIQKTDTSIGKWTLAAWVSYEITLLAISMSPLAGKGTGFGEPGLWGNMLLIGVFYLIPLIFYYGHIPAMRYVLAGVVIFWTIPLPFFILGAGGMFFFDCVMGRRENLFILALAIGVCAVNLAFHILWCLFCLKRRD